MKHTLTTVFLLLALAGSAFAQADFRIPSSRYDFGLIPQHSTVVHYFWFTVRSDDTLSVKKIVTGCTCTIPQDQPDKVGPNDSVLVGFTWDIEKRIGNTSVHPRIYHDGQEPNPIHIAMKGLAIRPSDTTRPVSVSPRKAELSVAGQVVIDSVEFVFHNHSKLDLEATVVSYPVSQCDVVIPDSVAAGADATGYIRILPQVGNNEFISSVTIEFSDPRKTRMTIPIRRKIY